MFPPWIVDLTLLAGGCGVPIVARFSSRSIYWLVLTTLLIAFLCALLSRSGESLLGLHTDSIGHALRICILAGGSLLVTFTRHLLTMERGKRALLMILPGMAGGTMALSTDSLAVMFVGFELCQIGFLLLASGLGRPRAGSMTQWLVASAVSSAMSAFALAVLYGLSGTLTIDGLKYELAVAHIQNGHSSVGVALAEYLILFAVAIRLIGPWVGRHSRHFLERSHPILLGWHFSVLVPVVVIFAFRVYSGGLFAFNEPAMTPNDWGLPMAVLAAAGTVLSSIAIFRTQSIREILLYLFLLHTCSLFFALVTHSSQAIDGLVISLAALIGSGAALPLLIGAASNSQPVSLSSRANRLGRWVIRSAATLAVATLVAFPYTLGFGGKIEILEAMLVRASVGEAYAWLFLVALALVLAIIPTLFGGVRVIRLLWGADAVAPNVSVFLPDRAALCAAIPLAILLGLYGFFPQALGSAGLDLPAVFGIAIP